MSGYLRRLFGQSSKLSKTFVLLCLELSKNFVKFWLQCHKDKLDVLPVAFVHEPNLYRLIKQRKDIYIAMDGSAYLLVH